jgi:hypothetical protein
MPFDLGDDPTPLRPASGLIGEICIGTPHVVRRPSDRTRQQMADPLLQDAVRWQADRVFDPLGFEELVYFRIGESRVSPEINARDLPFVSFDNRLQHALPPINTVDVAGTQRAAFPVVGAGHRHGHRERQLMGTFGPVSPCPSSPSGNIGRQDALAGERHLLFLNH